MRYKISRIPAAGRPGSRKPRQSGVAMIEATAVVFMMLLLLLGIMEVGRVTMTYNLLTRAVRDAARIAALKPDLVPGDSQVLDRINSLVKDGGATVSDSSVNFIGAPPQPNDPLRGEMFRVSARVDFLPAVPMEFGKSIPLQAQVIARHE